MLTFLKFIRQKWWLFLCFILALVLINLFEKGDPIEVLLLFIVYSFADFCMILMTMAWQENNPKKSGYYHLLACSTFTLIFIYQGVRHHEWHYAWVTIIFLIGALKAFFQNSLQFSGLNRFNWQLGAIIQVTILSLLFIYQYGPEHLVNWLEAIGMAGFSIVLLIKERDFTSPRGRRSNWLALATVGLLVTSSLTNTILQWQQGHINGLPIALTLFAFCVWLEYLQGLLKKNYPLPFQ
ncbi:hypothetical protein [Endozoicomonas sp. Mp262]|uniref:hypothetical protein n=1 Tax=Endozoicomonas sp. Mp262 TaxID=2919499 RepID=UPI0021D8641E